MTPIWRASGHTNIHSKSRFWGNLSLWDSNTGISKARLRFPQQALYKLLQENKVCTKSPLYTWASASEDLSASHSWPLRLYQQRSTGETQSFLYFFSLKELWKNKSPKILLHQITQAFCEGREGQRALCSPSRADAAQALLLLPTLHLPLGSGETNI